MSFFEAAVQHVLAAEGGYTNNINDKGGATNYGITLDTLKIYRNNPSLTSVDVKNLSIAEAKDIYKKMYWDPYSLSNLTDQSLAIAIFDQIVNRGPERAIDDLQIALNYQGCRLAVDGVIGPKTIAAANSTDSKKALKDMIKLAQIAYINIAVGDTKQLKFLRGWITRTHFLLDLV